MATDNSKPPSQQQPLDIDDKLDNAVKNNNKADSAADSGSAKGGSQAGEKKLGEGGDPNKEPGKDLAKALDENSNLVPDKGNKTDEAGGLAVTGTAAKDGKTDEDGEYSDGHDGKGGGAAQAPWSLVKMVRSSIARAKKAISRKPQNDPKASSPTPTAAPALTAPDSKEHDNK